MSVYVTLTLFIAHGVIEGYDWFATLASYGQPADVSPQTMETGSKGELAQRPDTTNRLNNGAWLIPRAFGMLSHGNAEWRPNCLSTIVV
jgi:hypothetical protein